MNQKSMSRMLGIVAASVLGLPLVSCVSEPPAAGVQEPATPPASGSGTTTVAPSAAARLVLLKTEPEQAPVGATFTITGQGLPPSKAADIVWVTWDGSFETAIQAGSIEFHQSAFKEKRVVIGRTTTDGQGGLAATLKVPEDYGEIHDIYVALDGRDVAKGGIRVPRVATISPTSGPVGTPITVSVNGIGWKKFDNTLALRWDNVYGGLISAVTTRGTATFVIRAAGPPGKHFIDLGDASAAVSYLNAHQTARQYKLPQFRFEFTVTADNGAPPATLEWPDGSRVATKVVSPLTSALGDLVAPASLSPSFGAILSRPTLQASGLPAGANLDVQWVTMGGNDLDGWTGKEVPLATATVGSNGSLTTPIDIPDDLGGWHTVRLSQGGKALAEAPYYVERSLVGVTPGKVRAGEMFTVEVKGIGWTELDNGVAVVYDNQYVGYACGFCCKGYVSFDLMATGGPGTHLIDLYPMTYDRGNMKMAWDYGIPFLTFAQDHPSLGLGYRLPVYRLAVEVMP